MTKDDVSLPSINEIDVRRGQTGPTQAGRTRATRDHDEIRAWAAHWRAEPATGVGVRNINDGGTELRFSFPGVGLLRPLSWEEWFAIFDAQQLVLVYADESPGQPATTAPQYRLMPGDELARRTGAGA
jgi:hypothetical protein